MSAKKKIRLGQNEPEGASIRYSTFAKWAQQDKSFACIKVLHKEMIDGFEMVTEVQ
jgi:hypothetical protein